MRVFLSLAVMVFWAVMMILLVARQARLRYSPTAYRAFLSKDTLISDQWLGIYLGGALVGFMHTASEPYLLRPGVSGQRMVNRTFLTISLLGQLTKVHFDSTALVDDQFQLESFVADFSSGAHRISARGKRKESDILAVEIHSHGSVTRRNISLPHREGVIISSMLSPFQSFGRLETGSRYDVKVFNPFTGDIESLRISVQGKETVHLPAGPQEAYALTSVYQGIEQYSWVSAEGELLKQQTLLGWELRREDSNIALRVYEQAGERGVELMDLISLKVALPRPADTLNRLQVLLTGLSDNFLVANHRQRIQNYDPESRQARIEIEREVVPASAAGFPQTVFPAWRQSSALIQADDPRIRELALSIVAGSRDSWDAAVRINQWVFEHIRKKPVVSIPSAIDVLKTREGDCNEHTALFTALARSVGIPTRMHVGLAYARERFFYHAWPSVHVGAWIDMDPTFGQDIADPSHITLIEGDLSKQVSVIQLLGALSLEVISAQ